MTNDEYDTRRHARDLELMRHPDRWPQAMLPLKRYVNIQPNGSCEIKFSTLAKPADQFYHWYPDSISTGPDFTQGEVGGDELLLKLIQTGWLVD